MVHSKLRRCPNCGGKGKVRWNRSYVFFVCVCGLNVSATDFTELERKLKYVMVEKTEA